MKSSKRVQKTKEQTKKTTLLDQIMREYKPHVTPKKEVDMAKLIKEAAQKKLFYIGETEDGEQIVTH